MIEKNIKAILLSLPKDVLLEAAVKNRTVDEVLRAVNAGVKIIGENYIQEAQSIISLIDRNKTKLHFIGHLQKNKVKKAVEIFDMIETVDSFGLASEIEKAALKLNKAMPVLIEVNIACEKQKFGCLPGGVSELAKKISGLKNLKLQGLMTMGPLVSNPEESRPYFRKLKDIFYQLKGLGIDNVKIQYLSMGMSDSYKIAIEEGANIIRIGSIIFGPRV